MGQEGDLTLHRWRNGRSSEQLGPCHRRTRPSVVPYGIEDPVRSSLVVGLSYTEPKAIKAKGMYIAIVGY